MIDDRPHTLFATIPVIAAEPYQDQTGDWVIGATSQDIQTPCRLEVNSAAVKVPGKDGIKVDYSFMIYLNQDAPAIPYDNHILVKNDKGEQIGEGDIKRFSRGSMDCRIWI